MSWRMRMVKKNRRGSFAGESSLLAVATRAEAVGNDGRLRPGFKYVKGGLIVRVVSGEKESKKT